MVPRITSLRQERSQRVGNDHLPASHSYFERSLCEEVRMHSYEEV
jgi:hypothetical protein